MNIILVGLGSMAGGILRYLIAFNLNSKVTENEIPWGTFAVNFIGCFIIGLIFSLQQKNLINHQVYLLLTTGILGGFTTFSTFSLETVSLIKAGLWQIAIMNIAFTLMSCLLGTIAGIYLAR